MKAKTSDVRVEYVLGCFRTKTTDWDEGLISDWDDSWDPDEVPVWSTVETRKTQASMTAYLRRFIGNRHWRPHGFNEKAMKSWGTTGAQIRTLAWRGDELIFEDKMSPAQWLAGRSRKRHFKSLMWEWGISLP